MKGSGKPPSGSAESDGRDPAEERPATIVGAGSARPKAAIDRLTDRERAIMPLLASGRTNKEIGKHLGISPETVKTHLSGILEKLEARSRTEAATKFVAANVPSAARGT